MGDNYGASIYYGTEVFYVPECVSLHKADGCTLLYDRNSNLLGVIPNTALLLLKVKP